MKLRVRNRHRTERIDLGTGQSTEKTLGDLLSCVERCFEVENGSFQLSLNGRDPIEGSNDETLDSFGIVSGDLIKVILPDSGGPADSAQASNVTSAGRTASNSTASQYMDPSSNLPSSHSDTATREAKPSSSAGTQKTNGDIPSSSGNAPSTENGKSSHHGNTDDGCTGGMSEDEQQAREQLAQLEENEDSGEKITEPMLCRDSEEGKIPLRLKQLCDEAQPKNANDMLCIALHVLMVETGFYAKENEGVSDKDTNMPSKMDCSSETDANLEAGGSNNSQVQPAASEALPSRWRMGTSYRLDYQHPECVGISCSVVCVPMGSTLLIHGMIDKQIQDSIQLKPSTYACLTNGEMTYQNLPLLSRTFKDGIVYPLLAAMRTGLGLPPLTGLLALLPEIQLKILSYLDLTSVINMSMVCHYMNSLTQDTSLWRQLVLRDFGGRVTDRNCNWKQKYKERYRLGKWSEKLLNRNPPVSMFPPPRRPFRTPDFPNPLPGIFPPQFRGGDYDLDPFGSGGALPGLRPNPSPLVPGPRHDPIFPNPDANFMPGRGGGLRDLEMNGPHLQQHRNLGPSGPRLGGRTPFGGSGGRRGFII